jgi:hypothetical protein
MFLALLVGCDMAESGGGDPSDTHGAPEPGLGGEPWAMCVETDRQVVADPTIAPEGFTEPASAVIAANEGDWTGAWSQYGDDAAVVLTASIAFDGEVTAVFLAPNEGDTGIYALGAPEASGDACLPYNEIPGELVLVSDDGALAETLAVVAHATGSLDPSLGGEILAADIAGSAESSMDGDWEDVSLSIWMNRVDAGFEGAMQWSGQSASDPDAGPSATSMAFAEPYGSFALARVP